MEFLWLILSLGLPTNTQEGYFPNIILFSNCRRFFIHFLTYQSLPYKLRAPDPIRLYSVVAGHQAT